MELDLPQVPWIGKFHVRPSSVAIRVGENGVGAYANVLALAESEADFLEIVTKEMLVVEGLVVIEADDVALVSEYEREGRISGELAELKDALSQDFPVQYRTFYTYSHDDA